LLLFITLEKIKEKHKKRLSWIYTTRILWYSVGQKPTQNTKNPHICVGIAWAREPH